MMTCSIGKCLVASGNNAISRKGVQLCHAPQSPFSSTFKPTLKSSYFRIWEDNHEISDNWQIHIRDSQTLSHKIK